MTTEPSACRACGLPKRGHCQRWSKTIGWHQWLPPTNAQIKARMLARRARRTP
jgi:hypothetical protein